MMANSLRAVAPAVSPPSFPEPTFCPARRIHGLVETPDEEEPNDVAKNKMTKNENERDEKQDESSSFAPPELLRQKSMAGNILLLEHPDKGHKAFLLQRKTATSTYGGSVRIGFCLRGDKPDDDGLWKMARKDFSSLQDQPATTIRKRDYEMMTGIKDQFEMVTICIESESHLLHGLGEAATATTDSGISSLKTELAAMQFIAEKSKTVDVDHLWGTEMIGSDNGSLCVVMTPWHSEGVLQDLCASQPGGVLSLEEAKFFFKQIVRVCQWLVRELGHRESSTTLPCRRRADTSTLYLIFSHKIMHYTFRVWNSCRRLGSATAVFLWILYS